MATDAVIYRWYLDGTLIETTPTPTVELDSLAPGAYALTNTSVDASGNESTPSDPLELVITGATARSSRMLTGAGA